MASHLTFEPEQVISSLDPRQLLDQVTGTGVITGGEPSPGGGPFDIDLTAPSVLIDGDDYSLGSQTISTIGNYVDESNPRWVLVYVTDEASAADDATVELVAGEAEPLNPPDSLRRYATSPQLPQPDHERAVPLFAVWVGSNTGEIRQDDIFNRRVLAIVSAYRAVVNELIADSITDGSGTEHTDRLAEASEGTNVGTGESEVYDSVRTDTDITSTIDADPTHGQRLKNNHDYRTNQEISDIARDMGVTELENGGGANGQFLRQRENGPVWDDVPVLNPPVEVQGTFEHSGGGDTSVLLEAVSGAVTGDYEVYISADEVPSWATDGTGPVRPEFSFERSFRPDYANNTLNVRVRMNWGEDGAGDPGAGNSLRMNYVVFSTEPQLVQGDYTDGRVIEAITGERIMPRALSVADQLGIPVVANPETIPGVSDGFVALATGSHDDWEPGFYYFLDEQGGWRQLLAADGDEVSTVTDRELDRGEYNASSWDLFVASDSGRMAVPDREQNFSEWKWLESTGRNPIYDTVSTDSIEGTWSAFDTDAYDALCYRRGGETYAVGRDGLITSTEDLDTTRQVIQVAINANSGGRIGLTPGQFPIDRSINNGDRALVCPHGTTLEGLGGSPADTVLRSTTTGSTNETNGMVYTESGQLTLRNIELNGDAIDGSGYDSRAISVLGTRAGDRTRIINVLFDRVRVHHFGNPSRDDEWAVHVGSQAWVDDGINSDARVSDVTNVRMLNCNFYDLPQTGAPNIKFDNVLDLEIRGCGFIALGEGVTVRSSEQASVGGNRFRCPSANYSLRFEASNGAVMGNQFREGTAPLEIARQSPSGVVLENIVVANNTLDDSGVILTAQTASSSQNAPFLTRVAVTNNTIINTHTHVETGIEVFGGDSTSRNILIGNNIVRRSAGRNITLHNCRSSLVQGNLASAAGSEGRTPASVIALDGTDVNFIGNHVIESNPDGSRYQNHGLRFRNIDRGVMIGNVSKRSKVTHLAANDGSFRCVLAYNICMGDGARIDSGDDSNVVQDNIIAPY